MLSHSQHITAVAVSGGADSLHTLARLVDEGRKVFALHGVFLDPQDEAAAAQALAVRQGLADSCARLGVPLHVLHCTEEFARLVIEPFVRAYAAGLTPNPCVRCNAAVKFGLLLQEAQKHGASALATGHYARLQVEGGVPALFQGSDLTKDQSYFLALVPLHALAHASFPLAETAKKDVPAALAARGLAVPQPGESQEVCFVPDDDYRAFLPDLAERMGLALPGPGPMLLADNTRVGTHKGLWRYTEGQRRGLGIGWREPLHVLAKEMQGNILRLGARHELGAEGCECEDVNLLLPPEAWPGQVLVKTRYREAPKEAYVEWPQPKEGGGTSPANAGCEHCAPRMRIHFAKRESAVACGQTAAIYIPWGDNARLRLVAGGIICAVV